MKHIVTILLSMMIIVGLTSCSPNDESSPGLAAEGYVFQMDGNRVLILDNVQQEDITKTWNEIFDHYQGRAIWLQTSDASKLAVGQKVRYWIDGPVAESFPEQGTAERIEVIME